MDPKLESAINLAEYRIEMGKVRYISPAEWRKIMDEVPAIRSRAELQAILRKCLTGMKTRAARNLKSRNC